MDFNGIKKPKKETIETSYGNPETKIIINKNCKSESQIMNFNKKKCLSRLYNSNNGLKKKLV